MTTKADLEQAIRRIHTRFTIRVNIDWISGRPRIMREDNGRFLSPRGSKAEIYLWLEGFEEGLESMEQSIKQIMSCVAAAKQEPAKAALPPFKSVQELAAELERVKGQLDAKQKQLKATFFQLSEAEQQRDELLAALKG